jgi:putative ABC transport system permease protein
MHDWRVLVRLRLAELRVDPARAADIVDELAQHVAQHHADLVAAGVEDGEALRRALAPLDRHNLARDITRADRRRAAAPEPPPTVATFAQHLARDVRYAGRLFLRSPGFAAAAILTLALGIGANAAIFSIVNAVVLEPPPYRDPARVFAFLNGRSGDVGAITSSSLPDYQDWQQQLTSFERIGLLSGWTFNATSLELPERLFGARVSGTFFEVLGTPALVGRTIGPDDDTPGGDEVIVLSYRLWQRLFAGDPAVVGRPMMLEGRPHVVIGVMPPRFHFPDDETELWAAIKDNMSGMPRNGRFMAVIGRLKPEATRASAQAEIDAVESRLEGVYPDTNRGWRVRLVNVHEASVGDTRPALTVLVGAVALVLLIACANVSNLLLARATSRSRETAIRLALGATGRRIVSQWLTENMLLSLLGGAAGVAVAYVAIPVIVAVGPPDVPRLAETTVDGTVLAFTFGLSLLAGALPALAPALRAARSSSGAGLREGGRTQATIGRGRAGAALVVAEIALAMTLAVAGALLLQSYARLTSVKPGFEPDRVLSFKVFLTPPRYRTVADGRQFITAAMERIAATSGVESAAAISQLPLSDPSSTLALDVDGRPTAPGDRFTAGYRAVSASYFDTMRIPVLRGRSFGDDDRTETQPVVIVNEAAARKLWPSADPIGRRIRWATGVAEFDAKWHTVVGVAADVRSGGLDKGEQPAIYAPYTQREFTWLRWTSFVVRTDAAPRSYARTIRQELAKLDPMQPVYEIASLDEVISTSTAARRFHTGLIDLFAALALALACVGVYGTVGYWVSERAHEIGIRLALGATARRVLVEVIRRAMTLTALGIGLGLALAAATSQLLASLLYGVRPFEPAIIAAAAAVVAAVAAAAAFAPARRAARLDPLTAIRGE